MEDQSGPFARTITRCILRELGYREPTEHSEFANLARIAQHCIDQEMDTMRRVAETQVRLDKKCSLSQRIFAKLSTFWGTT